MTRSAHRALRIADADRARGPHVISHEAAHIPHTFHVPRRVTVGYRCLVLAHKAADLQGRAGRATCGVAVANRPIVLTYQAPDAIARASHSAGGVALADRSARLANQAPHDVARSAHVGGGV